MARLSSVFPSDVPTSDRYVVKIKPLAHTRPSDNDGIK